MGDYYCPCRRMQLDMGAGFRQEEKRQGVKPCAGQSTVSVAVFPYPAVPRASASQKTLKLAAHAAPSKSGCPRTEPVMQKAHASCKRCGSGRTPPVLNIFAFKKSKPSSARFTALDAADWNRFCRGSPICRFPRVVKKKARARFVGPGLLPFYSALLNFTIVMLISPSTALAEPA